MKYLILTIAFILATLHISGQSYKVEIVEIPYDTLTHYTSIVKENLENGDVPNRFEKEFDLGFEFPYFDKTYNKITINNLPVIDITGFEEFPMQLVVVKEPYRAVVREEAGNYYSDFRYKKAIINGKKVLIVEFKNVDIDIFEDTEVDISFQYWFWENGNIEVRFGDFVYPEPYFKEGLGYYDELTDSYFGIRMSILSGNLTEIIDIGGNLNDGPIINYNANFDDTLAVRYLPKKNTVCRFKKTTSDQFEQHLSAQKMASVIDGYLEIPKELNFDQYFITDLQGSRLLTSKERYFDVFYLSPGLYFLSFITDFNIKTIKIFKK